MKHLGLAAFAAALVVSGCVAYPVDDYRGRGDHRDYRDQGSRYDGRYDGRHGRDTDRGEWRRDRDRERDWNWRNDRSDRP